MEDLDLTEVCRVCLTKHNDMQLAVEVGVVDRLLECASVQLPPESLICEFCKNEVDKWYSFKQQVLRSMEVVKYMEEQQKKRNEKVISDNYAVIEELFVKTEVNNDFNVEIKPEIIDEDDEVTSNGNSDNEDEEVHRKKIYQCDICNKVLSSLSGIYYHKRSHTDIPLNISNLEMVEERSVTPPLKQEAEDEDNKKYQCDLCHKSFNSKNGIMWHKQLHSALKLDLSKDSERFPCSYCPMIYEKKLSLIDHMKWKHNRYVKRLNPNTTCDVCGKCFKTNAYLKLHLRAHNKPYKCEVCKKGFTTFEDLSSHRRNMHACPDCGKVFKRLHRHKRTHISESPHKCDVCDMTFQDKSSLKKHMKNH